MANKDYLRWDALSLKDLIVAKLTEDGTYSDQLFEGSDLSVLIDIFCYMYDTLTFLENVGAAEAIFTDTQFYENMNRIVKMLGYNPMGYQPSIAEVNLGIRDGLEYPIPPNNESTIVQIPRFTTITTDLADKDGNPIEYTFTEDFVAVVFNKYVINNILPRLYNGTWKVYPNTFEAVGIPYETFTLADLPLGGPNRKFVAHGKIHIYIEEPGENSSKVIEWKPTNNIYDAGPTDRVFEYRINEKQVYTITFGDDINGKKIPKNSFVTIVYLEGNGPDGEIGANIINEDLEMNVKIQGLTEEYIKEFILQIQDNPEYIKFGTDPNETLSLLTAKNLKASSFSKDLENVESIRHNAPKWFRKGYRLITESDFENYIKIVYGENVLDVKCFNNWKYMVDFLSWLKKYNYLTADIANYGYKFSDSCDFNNVYLWLKSKNYENLTPTTKEEIEFDCNKIKPLTSEIVPLDPFITMVTPYLAGDYDITNFNPDFENKIIILRDNNSMVSVEKLHQQVSDIFVKYFDLNNQTLGAEIDVNFLYQSIMDLNGVKKVQTSFLKNGMPESETKYFDGLSLAIWTPHIIHGADFNRITGNLKLNEFQFPKLYNSENFNKYIKVKSDIYSISNLEF
jgi:hypothetical protein